MYLVAVPKRTYRGVKLRLRASNAPGLVGVCKCFVIYFTEYFCILGHNKDQNILKREYKPMRLTKKLTALVVALTFVLSVCVFTVPVKKAEAVKPSTGGVNSLMIQGGSVPGTGKTDGTTKPASTPKPSTPKATAKPSTGGSTSGGTTTGGSTGGSGRTVVDYDDDDVNPTPYRPYNPWKTTPTPVPTIAPTPTPYVPPAVTYYTGYVYVQVMTAT